jgi:hypothetical protein
VTLRLRTHDTPSCARSALHCSVERKPANSYEAWPPSPRRTNFSSGNHPRPNDGGEPNLTYTWSCSGPAGVTFSVNGPNKAKNTTATFPDAGRYTFQVTIADVGGLTATGSIAVTVVRP